MSGVTPKCLVREEVAGPAHAALHLVEDEEDVVPVAERRASPRGRPWEWALRPLRPDRLDHDRRRLLGDGGLERVVVAERDMVEALEQRREAVGQAVAAGGRDGRHGAAVKAALEGDDAVALGLAAAKVEAPRHLDAGFHRLGAGIAHEHGLGEGMRHQPVGEALQLLDAEEVGDMPEPGRLLLQRLDQMRVAMAERVDRDAAGEIEKAAAVARVQPGPLAALEGEVDPAIGGHQRGNRGVRAHRLGVQFGGARKMTGRWCAVNARPHQDLAIRRRFGSGLELVAGADEA